jgi:hypothetical protein
MVCYLSATQYRGFEVNMRKLSVHSNVCDFALNILPCQVRI